MKEVYMNIDAFYANYTLGREMLWKHVNTCVGIDIRKRDMRIVELERVLGNIISAEVVSFAADEEARKLLGMDLEGKDE